LEYIGTTDPVTAVNSVRSSLAYCVIVLHLAFDFFRELNVLITGHQAFFTRKALTQIARTTLQNLSDLEQPWRCANEIEPQ
jgi:lactate dehydrogenase-like 2-hydroxyacid dehydrogenase